MIIEEWLRKSKGTINCGHELTKRDVLKRDRGEGRGKRCPLLEVTAGSGAATAAAKQQQQM